MWAARLFNYEAFISILLPDPLLCPLGYNRQTKKRTALKNATHPLLYFHLIDLTMKNAIDPVIPTIKIGSTHTLKPSLTPFATSEHAQVM